MEITVVPSDYIKWAYAELNKYQDEYVYVDLKTHEVCKCRLTSLEFHTLFDRTEEELWWDGSGVVLHYLRSCIIPRKVLKTLIYTNSSVTLKGEEVGAWVNFVARTIDVYYKTIRV